jgi:fucose 4-O-acetylase-like acetyltransferase
MASASRNLETDCIKGALIILVVAGHFIKPFADKFPVYLALDSAFTAFRMPLFLITVGMFSRSMLTEKDYHGIFNLLILPLVVFQFAYLFPLWLVTGKLLTPALMPYYHLWFLLSLVVMKLSLPLAARIPFALPASIAAAVLAGYDPGISRSFALSRTIHFFPFFLAGHLYGREIISLVNKQKYLFGALFIVVMIAIGWWSFHGLPNNSFNGTAGYAELSVFKVAPALGRAVALCLSVLAAMGFIAWVPTKMAKLAYLGQRSMVVYILHGYVALAVTRAAMNIGEDVALWLIPVWMLLAAAITLFLAQFNAPFKQFFHRMGDYLISAGQRKTRNDVASTEDAKSGTPLAWD